MQFLVFNSTYTQYELIRAETVAFSQCADKIKEDDDGFTTKFEVMKKTLEKEDAKEPSSTPDDAGENTAEEAPVEEN